MTKVIDAPAVTGRLEDLNALTWRHKSQLERAIDFWRERVPIPLDPTEPKITFIRTDFDNRGLSQVYETKEDGTQCGNVTNNPQGFDDTPAWSPDFSRIVFARASSTIANPALWTMRADGTQQQPLTTPPAGSWDVEPRFSPDGTTIAFQRFYAIWLVNADGTNPRELPASQNPNPFALHTMPSWNPNGTEIAFCRQQGGTSGIVAADVNGAASQFTVLTYNPDVDGLDAWPAWSPDGTKVAFSRNDGDTIKIWTVDASGDVASEVALSAPDDAYADHAPSWSPDGTQIAFQRSGGYPYRMEIWVMDADGGNEVNVSALTGIPAHSADSFPNWGK
jgi:Tol biopolymer transport system component